MDYPECPGIYPDLPWLQHAPEGLPIAAASVLVVAEGHNHIVIKVSADPFRARACKICWSIRHA